jgi:hypothetical protein
MPDDSRLSLAQNLATRFPDFGLRWPLRPAGRPQPHWEKGDPTTTAPAGILAYDPLNASIDGFGIIAPFAAELASGGTIGTAVAIALAPIGSVPGSAGAPAFLGNTQGIFQFVLGVDAAANPPVTASTPVPLIGLDGYLDPLNWNGLAFDGATFLYVLNQGGSVYRFSYDGTALTAAGVSGATGPTFIDIGTGGLTYSEGEGGIALGPSGTLAVAQNEQQNVLLFSILDGSFVDSIDFTSPNFPSVTPVTPGYGPDGNLYVVSVATKSIGPVVAGVSGAILRFTESGTPLGAGGNTSDPTLVTLGAFDPAFALTLGGTAAAPIVYASAVMPGAGGAYTTSILAFDGNSGAPGTSPDPAGTTPSLFLAIAAVYAQL